MRKWTFEGNKIISEIKAVWITRYIHHANVFETSKGSSFVNLTQRLEGFFWNLCYEKAAYFRKISRADDCWYQKKSLIQNALQASLMPSGITDTVFQAQYKYLLKQRMNQIGFWTYGRSGVNRRICYWKGHMAGEENKSQEGVMAVSWEKALKWDF